MENKQLNPIKLDIKNIREDRQKINNLKVFNAIKNKDKKELLKNCNNNELERVLKDLKDNIDGLIDKCSNNDYMNNILSGRISKNATRQGCKDESIQLSICNEVSKYLDINIENLTQNAYRPKKTGEIINHKEFKDQCIFKDECLKSFDGKISGRMNGWIFAKVVYGNGGHQDNVFEEADTICKWVEDFHNDDSYYYVILLDTDLTNKFNILKEKYIHIKNIIITNHFEFQQYIIDNYSFNK